MAKSKTPAAAEVVETDTPTAADAVSDQPATEIAETTAPETPPVETPETPADPVTPPEPVDDRISMVEAHEREASRLTAEGQYEAAAAVERLTMLLAEMRAHVLSTEHLREHSTLLSNAYSALH